MSYLLLNNEAISNDIALLYLDRELRVMWFTLALQKLFNLSFTGPRCSLAEFSPELAADGLIDDATTVVKTRTSHQRELKMRGGHDFVRRIFPCISDKNSLCGIGVLYSDVHTNKHDDEEMAIEAYKRLREPVERRMQKRIARVRVAQLRALTMGLTLAEEYERYALAQYLYDSVSELLAAAELQLTEHEQENSSSSSQLQMAEINLLLTKAHQSVHAMIFQLCPPLLHESGLVSALERLAKDIHHECDLNVAIENNGLPTPLALPVAALTFRAVRELLLRIANSARIDRMLVSVERAGVRLKVVMADPDRGLEYGTVAELLEGLSLQSIQERLNCLDGGIEIECMPDKSPRITLLAPLAPEAIASEWLQ